MAYCNVEKGTEKKSPIAGRAGEHKLAEMTPIAAIMERNKALFMIMTPSDCQNTIKSSLSITQQFICRIPFVAIAAVAKNGVIGYHQKLPWHDPLELQHFKNTTMGHVMIMGRKTFLSMPKKAFLGRRIIVLSKTISQTNPIHCHFDDLYKVYQQNPALLKLKQYVIGGEEIYNLFFKKGLIQTALISHMHHSYEGDRFFPFSTISHWPKKLLVKEPHFSVFSYHFSHSLAL
jgi:dihydrofolate reductase